MKFDVMERDVESSQSLSSKKITLSANAKAFKIIFGQIYPDIIKAIVRELFTNAWDSQKMAGTLETPIEIHLPTKWEPYFSIRDFGLGMPPQLIDDVYSKVFESTKDDSNDEAGMFGMGSKTPLGYTDAFTVMSYVDGTYYAYDIYIGKGGDPSIDLKATGQCDEPNGVEVSLSVREDDFDQFKSYAELFAINAGTPININRTRVLQTREKIFTGPSWELYSDRQETFMRMGCVLYKIDRSLIVRDFATNYNLQRAWQTKLQLPLIIDFPIGTFDVTGSREDIIYNNDVIKRIRARIDEVIDEMTVLVNEKINSAKNFSEAVRFYEELYSIFHNIPNVMPRAKYKSWKHSKWHEYCSSERLGLKGKINFNPETKSYNGGIGNFRSNDITYTMLHGRNQRLTYVIIDHNEKGGKVALRIRNLKEKLRESGFHDRHYNIIWIKAKKDVNLTRLKVILPPNYLIIDIDDIIPAVVVREAKEKEDSTSFRLRACDKKDARLTAYHDRVEDGSYYVTITKRELDLDPVKIAAAARVLGVPLGQIHAISKTNEWMIEDHDLVELIEAADAVRATITYEDDAYYYNAILHLNKDEHAKKHGYQYWIPSYESQYCTSKVVKHLTNWPHNRDIDPDKVDNFVNDVNPAVEAKFDQVYKGLIENLDRIYKAHPTLKWVEGHTLKWKADKILIHIGEMKE